MRQESHDDRLNQLEGILSGELKPPPGESAGQLAFILFDGIVQDIKKLTEAQFLKLSQLAPLYLSFSITQPKQTLLPLYTDLELAIRSRLPLHHQVIFYRVMAESCADRGWWFNPHPAALKDLEALDYVVNGLSLGDNKPFEIIGHRLYIHAVQQLQADVYQQKWPEEKKALIAECQRILLPESKSSFDTLYQQAERLVATVERLTFISAEERQSVWTAWSVHWHTQQEEIDHKAAGDGDRLFQQFRSAILACLNPENKRSAEDLKLLCQQQQQMIKAMARYGEREKTRWQLYRYHEFIKKTKENLIEGTKSYYKKNDQPHWLAVIEAADQDTELLNKTLADIPSGFPKAPSDKIAQQWLTWRQRFLQIKSAISPPTRDQIPDALRHNANQARILWADIFAGCIDLLGPPPCPVAWVPNGSIVREEPLPSSDFDGLILIRDPDDQNGYFTTLIHLLWFHGLLLPRNIFPLESQDFKAMLNNPDTRLLNTPEALANYFWALIDGHSSEDHIQFSVGFPGALFLEEPPRDETTKHRLWQYQQELLASYQTKLSKHAPEESARRLSRWIMQNLVAKQAKNALVQLKSFLDPIGELPKVNLKNHLLRPLTWWCLAMKLAYRLPDTIQSSHAILSALMARNIFPAPWLQQLQQWESQIHYWRWQKYQPSSQELQTAFQQIYCVLAFSTEAWLKAEEKQLPPATFNPPEAMVHTVLTGFSPSTPVAEKITDERDQIKYLTRLLKESCSAALYSQIPPHWRGYFVDEYMFATAAPDIKLDARLACRIQAIALFLENKESKPSSQIASFNHFFNNQSAMQAETSVLTQLSEKLKDLLPPPPCSFWPFVLPEQEQANRYMLGIAVADEKLNGDTYFSHWAECFAEMVKINSAEQCHINISMVNRFLRSSTLPSHFLTGTVAQLAAQSEYFATRLANTGLMRWLSREEKPIIPLHAHLNWQRDLLALTCEQPDGKAPCAQLSWPEAKETRYLSPQLTRRLFHTRDKNVGQLASAQRSATPGQSDVWRLTAKDFSQLLPEYSSNTILGYLKTHPAHLWRQWQHATLVQRIMPDYGMTGSVAMLQYDAKSEPIPVWLSSPAGLTFCNLEDHQHSESSPDIQLLDEKGQAKFSQYAAQLDPYSFTLLVFLTYLLVHEDDQLRNLGWRLFMNALGATVSKIIPFDTDTCLGPPWIRTADGKVQIKLKSVVFCLDAMAQQELNPAAIQTFLALDSITVLEEWLKEINVATAPENTLPSDALDALYQRWQQIRSVLELPQESKDPMAPIFPRTHLDWLELVDPVLGQAYREAHQQHTNPLVRFTAIAQDYVVVDKMRISKQTGTLRGASIAALSRTAQASSFHMKPEHALTRCRQYRQQQQKVQPLVAYLTQQASLPTAIFEQQISRVIGDIPKLNQQTQKYMEQHHQQQNDLERLRTRARLWQPLAEDPDLSIILILPDSKASPSVEEWQTTCAQTAKPGLRLAKNSESNPWKIYAHNGKNLIINGQLVDQVPEDKEGAEAKHSWDLRSWQKHLTSPPNITVLRAACRSLHLAEQPKILRSQQLIEETERALKQLAEQRQAQISRQLRSETKSPTLPRSESDFDFLLDLQDLLLRQTVLCQLQWGQLPVGKGLELVLRLLELGGLTELNLQDCATIPKELVLACVQNSPYLRRLNISGCINLSDNSLVQIAAQARSLTRLAARGLPKIKELWQGWLWLTHTPLRFPQLTHLDLRNSTHLARLHIQAPALRYLCLDHSGIPNQQEWILEMPQLQVINLSHCHLSRLSIQSDALETLDLSASSLTLPVLKAMLMPERWPTVCALNLTSCEQSEWQLLCRYPFLTSFAEEWVSVDKLTTLNNAFTLPQVAADLARLPTPGRWRLQIGLMLFLWQQSQQLFKTLIQSVSDPNHVVKKTTLQILQETPFFTFIQTSEALDACLSLLRDPNSNVREAAVTAIVHISTAQATLTKPALDACLPLLCDSNRGIRYTAIIVIDSIGPTQATLAKRALDACLLLLREPGLDFCNERVRDVTVAAIGRIGKTQAALAKPALDACLLLLRDSDSGVRKAAVAAIGRIGKAQAALAKPALDACLLLLHDSDSDVRKAAVAAIGHIGTAQDTLAKPALDACLSLLRDPNSNVREAAVTAIGHIGSTQATLAKPALDSCLSLLGYSLDELEDKYVRVRAIEAIGRIGTAQATLAKPAFDACLPLLSNFLYWDIDYAVESAIYSICKAQIHLAKPAFDACLPLLRNSDSIWSTSRSRSTAAEIIRQSTMAQITLAKPALDACLPLLHDSSSYVRRDVLIEISHIGIAQVILAKPALYACLPLLRDSDSQVRNAAVIAICRIGTAQATLTKLAFDACLPLLRDSDSLVRNAAVIAICNIGTAQATLTKPAFDACLPLLRDSEPIVRWDAVTAIGHMGATHATWAKPVLYACLPLLKDSDNLVRSKAREAIFALTTAQPKLIYSLLKGASALLENSNKEIVWNVRHLFISLGVDYQIQLGQTLEEYAVHFLQRWFIQHPVESKLESFALDPKLRGEEKQDEAKTVLEGASEVKSTQGLAAPLDRVGEQSSAPKSTKLSSEQTDNNSNAVSHTSVERKRENSETDSKFLMGFLPKPNKEFKALEKPVPGDGNCGFSALGITRQEIVKMLDSCVNNLEARRLISTEIHEFCLSGLLGSMLGALDDKSYDQLSELKGCHDAIASAEQKLNAKKDEINQLLDRQPVNASYMEDKTAPLINRLCQRLEFYKPDHYLKLIEEVKQLHSSVVAAQQNYQAQLESEPTYMAYANAYLIDGERPKLWLGYQTALLYARFSVTQPINLYIWKKITPDGKQIACEASHYHYAGEGCVTYHILHTNGYTHFNILEPAETARLSQGSLLVQASTRSPATSSSFTSQLG